MTVMHVDSKDVPQTKKQIEETKEVTDDQLQIKGNKHLSVEV